MNRIHIQIYDDFVITGSHFRNIVKGDTRRIIFPDANDIGVTGKLRYNDNNDTSSLVLNVDENDRRNYFFISIPRNNKIVGNFDYASNSVINLNNQFLIGENEMEMLYRTSAPLYRSKCMDIDIGESELTRLDFRINNGPYFATAFGSFGPIMCRANGNTGIPMLRDFVREEAASRIFNRAQIITREYLIRFLVDSQNLSPDAEGLFAQICHYTGVDRFIR